MTPVRPDRLNRRRYSLYAPGYDFAARLLTAPRRAAVGSLRLRPGERLLIVGCGTGLDLDFVPRGVVVTGLDIAPGMLARARTRAARLGHAATLLDADARALPFPAASFDVAILHLILAVAPEPGRIARETARVLRPGGRVSIFDKFLPDAAAPSPLRRLLNLPLRALFSDFNLRAGPLVAAAGWIVDSDVPAGFRGLYRRIGLHAPPR